MPSVSNEINKLIKSTSYNVINQTVEISYMDDTKITIPVDSIADFNASNPSQMIDLTNYIYTPYFEITVEIDHYRTMHNRNSDGTLSFIFGIVKGIRKIDEKIVCLPNGKLMPLSDLSHHLKIKANYNIGNGQRRYVSFHKGEVLPYQILGFDGDSMEIKVKTYKCIDTQERFMKRTDFILNAKDFLTAEIDKSGNNVNSLLYKNQDYLPQLSFNRGDKYALVLQGEEDFQNIERTYAVVGKIDKLNNIEIDAVIVKQIGGDNTTIFSLTKADCKELGIKYVPGLQLFPANMNWKQIEEEKDDVLHDVKKKREIKETSVKENTNDIDSALYNLYYSDFIFNNNGYEKEKQICIVKSKIINTTYEDNSITSVIIRIEGFFHCGENKIMTPEKQEMDVEDFLASLKVITAEEFYGDIDSYTDNKMVYATFKKYENLPFRVKTIVNYNREYMEICDDNHIDIEIDLTKPCVEIGQTITGYIGISDLYDISSDDFIVAWLYKECEEDNNICYWQFNGHKDFYEKYL